MLRKIPLHNHSHGDATLTGRSASTVAHTNNSSCKKSIDRRPHDAMRTHTRDAGVVLARLIRHLPVVFGRLCCSSIIDGRSYLQGPRCRNSFSSRLHRPFRYDAESWKRSCEIDDETEKMAAGGCCRAVWLVATLNEHVASENKRRTFSLSYSACVLLPATRKRFLDAMPLNHTKQPIILA